MVFHDRRNRFDQLQLQVLVLLERNVLQIQLKVLQQRDQLQLNLNAVVLAQGAQALHEVKHFEHSAQQVRLEEVEYLRSRRRQEEDVRLRRHDRHASVHQRNRVILQRQVEQPREESQEVLDRAFLSEVLPTVVRIVEHVRLSRQPAFRANFPQLVQQRLEIVRNTGRTELGLQLFRRFSRLIEVIVQFT